MQRVVKNDFDVSVQNVEEVFNSIDGYYEILGVRLRFAQSHVKLHMFHFFPHFLVFEGSVINGLSTHTHTKCH